VRKNVPALSVENALSLQVSGRIEEAARIYRQILTTQPRNADALHFLGVIAHNIGQLDEAAHLIGESLRELPNNEKALNNLGNVLKDQRRFDEAIKAYRAALAIVPGYAQAHSNLGNVFKELGDPAAAAGCYCRALEFDPKSYGAHCNLGAVRQAQGNASEAIECYGRALELNPKSEQVLANMGAVLRENGRFQEALDFLQKALELNPNSEAAHVNMGATLKELGRITEAIECQWRALKINPRSHMALNNLGNALKEQGRFAEAVVVFEKALAINPASDLALSNLGLTLNELGRSEEAAALFRKAVAIQPANANALSNLLLTLNYLPEAGCDEVFAEHRRFGRIFGDPLTRIAASHLNAPDPDRPLRVGFVSGDLRNHPVAHFIEPVFAMHKRADFEFFCYANQPVDDGMTAQLQRQVEHWNTVIGLSDDELSAAIRRDGIDILVDLSGHTARNRLLVFARKPAPVQATMIGYMQTTGLAAMDYRITDAALDPVGVSECFSTEQLVRLPAGASPFRPPAESPPVNEAPALKNGFVTFASFNNPAKVTPRVLECWAEILRAVPTAKLLVVGRPGNSIVGNLESLGIAPERAESVNRLPLAEYLALHHRADLLLDTFPFNGLTTTLVAAWMGVPVVTLAGSSTPGRAGAALLNEIGLSHLIATSPADYVAKAVSAAGDLRGIAGWRNTARQRLAPHFNDGSLYTRQLESAFREMWRKWCAAQKPQALAA